MCFGGGASQPQAPQVQYVGPSEADIRRNEEALATFQTQIQDQNAAFQKQLQDQIDAANADYAKLEETFADVLQGEQQAAGNAVTAANSAATGALSDAQKAAAGDLSAAAAGAALVQSGAYKVGTTESDPVNAQETKAITDKKKPKSSLKINTGGTQASAGTGLNIGV